MEGQVHRRQRQQAVGQAAHRPGLLINKLDSDRFRLTTLREWEWNPASYNVAGPLDLILNTEYAAQPQRLRTLLKRIASIPAYYEAARANIVNPTREHTRLAIKQAPGVQTVLTEIDKAAQASILTPVEKQLFTQRVNAALNGGRWLCRLPDRDGQADGHQGPPQLPPRQGAV
jgi:hypothetical protein